MTLRGPHLQSIYRRLCIPDRRVENAPQYFPDGSFGTAPLKEYPPRMSALLLATFWSSMRTPIDHLNDYNFMLSILSERCCAIDDDTMLGPTPRGQPELDDSELQLLRAWPSDDPRFGPDFNTATMSVLKSSTSPHSSRQDFPRLVRQCVQAEHV